MSTPNSKVNQACLDRLKFGDVMYDVSLRVTARTGFNDDDEEEVTDPPRVKAVASDEVGFFSGGNIDEIGMQGMVNTLQRCIEETRDRIAYRVAVIDDRQSECTPKAVEKFNVFVFHQNEFTTLYKDKESIYTIDWLQNHVGGIYETMELHAHPGMSLVYLRSAEEKGLPVNSKIEKRFGVSLRGTVLYAPTHLVS